MTASYCARRCIEVSLKSAKHEKKIANIYKCSKQCILNNFLQSNISFEIISHLHFIIDTRRRFP